MWSLGIFKKKKRIIPNKDPDDFTLTESSTGWELDYAYCTRCKHSLGHNEYMSKNCNGCGSFNTGSRYGRSFRKIYINGKWLYQIKYDDGKYEIRENWYD